MAIPLLSNVAGAAQAQRHNAFNQNKADQTAKDAAARAVRDRLMLGLVDSGVNALMTFGGKAYDEATTGARDAQRLKSDLDQRERANVLDLADRNIDQLGYTPKSSAPAPSYSDGSTGSAMDDRSSARGRGGIEGAGDVARIMTEQGTRETAPADVVDPYAALSPLQKAAQMTLERSRRAAQESAAAQATRQRYLDSQAEQKFAFDVEKAVVDSQGKAATNIKNLAPSRYTVPPYKATPGDMTPKFGLQRVEFGPQSRATPSGGGGSGGGRATPTLIGALAEPVELIAAREGRKGDPTTGSLTRTIAARGEWAQAAIKNPAKYGLTPAEVAKVAQGFRIAQANVNDPSKADVVATAIATMDEARKASIARVGPLIAQVGDTLGTSPADAARVQQSDADRETARRRQAAADAERAAGVVKDAELAKLGAEGEIVKIEATARDRANRLAADIGRSSRAQLAGLSPAAYAEAMLGGQPPGDLTPRQLQAWQRAMKDGAPIRDARDRLRTAAQRAAEIKARSAGPGVSLAPVDLSTHESIRAAVADGRITRQQAAEAFRKLGEVVTE